MNITLNVNAYIFIEFCTISPTIKSRLDWREVDQMTKKRQQ